VEHGRADVVGGDVFAGRRLHEGRAGNAHRRVAGRHDDIAETGEPWLPPSTV
jgi:hypothetical protein